MNITIIGKSQINFTDKMTGNIIAGTKIHVAFKSDNASVDGMEVSSFFLRDTFVLPFELIVGKTYSADFNNKGRLIGIKETK